MSEAEILELNCDDLCEFLTDQGVHPYAVEKIKGKFLFCNTITSFFSVVTPSDCIRSIYALKVRKKTFLVWTLP